MKEDRPELIRDEMSERIVDAVGRIALAEGTEGLNVRRVLQELDISNRVFYNRFKNIGEVLDLLYARTVQSLRDGVTRVINSEGDFFQRVIDMVGRSLSISYDAKMKLNYFIYEQDSKTESNYAWWKAEIKKLIDFAKEREYIRDVDSDILSYSIWCFVRGYNADAVARGLPKEEAIRNFQYSFAILLDGLRKK